MTDRLPMLRSFLAAAAVTSAVLGLSACAGGSGGSGTRPGSVVTLAGTLTGAQEVPSNTRAGQGVAQVRFDKDSRVLTYRVTYTGLSGPVSGAHIHGPAAPGANAPVVVPFTLVTPATEGTLAGQAALDPTQAGDLLAGLYYVNIHTAAHPGGEIRAQLRLAP